MAAAGVGLDTYLDFLDDTNDIDQCEKETLQTPRIDQVLQKYRENPSELEQENLQKCHDHTPNNYHDDRLVAIEQQLAELLGKNQKKVQTNGLLTNKETGKQTKQRRGRRVSSSSSCDSDCPPHKNTRERRKKDGGKDNTTKNPTASNQRLGVRSLREDGMIRSQLQASSRLSRPDRDDQRKKIKKAEDKVTKERDLEQERERRWKAEQAAVKLAEHVRSLQLQVHQHQQKHDLLVAQCSKLESSLVKERDQHSKARQDRDTLQSNQSETAKELEVLKKRCGEQSNLLRDLESQLDRLERERLQQTQRLRDAEIRCGASERETSLQQQTASKLQQQIYDLQELLATRERDHQKELSKLKPLNCHDFRSMIDREVERERVRIEEVVGQLKERLEQQQKSYRDLEEEFRTALRIEASRYQQLEQSHEKMVTELVTCQESLDTLKEKENKSTGLVTELTTIVKEQKGRLVDLTSSRQELLRELREKTKLLEEERRMKNRLEERASALQEENGRLLAKFNAQESVISGLREERKLWGQELAIQGASLAQDRGKMEGKIESLNREVQELRDRLESSNTALRVKDKVIEDEAKTIKALKEQVQNYKTELSSLQSEWSKRLDSVQNQFDRERATCQDVHDQLDLMAEEKLVLEDRLQEVEEKEATWKEKYRSLKAQWEERVSVISALEQSVHQLQEKARERQQHLELERNHALEETRECRKKLDHAKQVYKEQLITQEMLMRNRLEEEVQGKEREVLEARGRMEEMEKEMRALLGETAKERKTMEEKFQRLSRTFHELQKELT